MVVAIDHHAAHIFNNPGETEHGKEVTIEPYDPHHFHHHLIHRKEAHYKGDRVPEETSFYEEVAKALVPAQEIVLIGHGTGKSSAVDYLVEYLKKHHGNISQRITATEIADLSALTQPQIEALAKKHMTAVS
jgi:stalled ribosome rescue protein Dom34